MSCCCRCRRTDRFTRYAWGQFFGRADLRSHLLPLYKMHSEVASMLASIATTALLPFDLFSDMAIGTFRALPTDC